MSQMVPPDESPFVDIDVDGRPDDASSVATAEPVARMSGTVAPDPDPDAPKTFTAGSKPTYERAQTVVIRRKRRAHAAVHGGAWKIAYADFVTAMMAFFLLMWLLSSSNHGTLQGIADYFNRPLQALSTEGPGASATTSPQTDEQKQQQQRADETRQLDGFRARLTTLIQQSPNLQAFKNQIKIDITSEGLRIQIVDDKNRPMFDKGNADLKDYTKAILAQIGPALNGVPNHVSIAGHTDALSYAGAASGFSNWELSTERANAARRELIAGGMASAKVLQVRGLADSIPLLTNDPANPANRRISIVVLNKQAEENFRRDGVTGPMSVP